jgi:hypothetical protein
LAFWEELPTAARSDLIPVEAITFKVTLPFDEFGSNLRVYGGYGGPVELSYGMMAHLYEGELEARTLIGLWPYPVAATVRDTTGTTRPDSSLAFVGGRVVAKFDTIASVHDGPVELAVGALEDSWHYRSASWRLAVDTVLDSRPWQEEGAGPVLPLAVATWDPAEGDSVIFEVDSAAVAIWADSAGAKRGMRLDALTEGVRLQTQTVRLFLITRPSSNPDTLLDLLVQARYRTFVYEPVLETPDTDLRVGGVPAWRTVFDMDFPAALDGPAELCALVECPLVLEPQMVNSALLTLKTGETQPAFRPSDSLRLDLREVLEPGRLPKSPLGSSLTSLFGVAFPPEVFGDSAGTRVTIPISGYVSDLIAAKSQPDLEIPGTLALLSAFEPLSLPFATFLGLDGADGPEIELILTVGKGVELR